MTLLQSSPAATEADQRDYTADLPDEVLALVFQSVPSVDRNVCSLVCRRWLAIEGDTRSRLALRANESLSGVAINILRRFPFVAKLALKGERRIPSIRDETLILMASMLSCLSRLKLRTCRQLTDAGLAGLGTRSPLLRKLSIASCSFSPKAFSTVAASCPLLEDLSIKRLRGLNANLQVDCATAVFATASNLKSICLKDICNAQCFVPLISASKQLRSLKLIRCSGSWDLSIEEITASVPGISEIHLEKLQLGDRGLFALSKLVSLEVLFLVRTPECTNCGVTAVANGCHRLRKLHIDGWRMDRIGDPALCAVASGCPELQELVLMGINPTMMGLALVAASCQKLERLALCGCETVGDAEVACLATRCSLLKKLCIKNCPVSDLGLEALSLGCPCLVKVKLKRCSGVTMEGIKKLKLARGETFAVSLDTADQHDQDALSASENAGMSEAQADQIPVLVAQMAAIDFPFRSAQHQQQQARNRMRNFVVSTLRRLSSGSGNPPPPPI